MLTNLDLICPPRLGASRGLEGRFSGSNGASVGFQRPSVVLKRARPCWEPLDRRSGAGRVKRAPAQLRQSGLATIE